MFERVLICSLLSDCCLSSLSGCVSQGASALFDMIEYYESATHLNISFNKHIGTRGWQAAAHMMRKVRTREYASYYYLCPILYPYNLRWDLFKSKNV